MKAVFWGLKLTRSQEVILHLKFKAFFARFAHSFPCLLRQIEKSTQFLLLEKIYPLACVCANFDGQILSVSVTQI